MTETLLKLCTYSEKYKKLFDEEYNKIKIGNLCPIFISELTIEKSRLFITLPFQIYDLKGQNLFITFKTNLDFYQKYECSIHDTIQICTDQKRQKIKICIDCFENLNLKETTLIGYAIFPQNYKFEMFISEDLPAKKLKIEEISSLKESSHSLPLLEEIDDNPKEITIISSDDEEDDPEKTESINEEDFMITTTQDQNENFINFPEEIKGDTEKERTFISKYFADKTVSEKFYFVEQLKKMKKPKLIELCTELDITPSKYKAGIITQIKNFFKL